MPRRPAKVTQADIARAIRAAKDAGASAITVDAEGSIRIALTASAVPSKPTNGLDELWTSYRQILVTAGAVRRRRLWADGRSAWR